MPERVTNGRSVRIKLRPDQYEYLDEAMKRQARELKRSGEPAKPWKWGDFGRDAFDVWIAKDKRRREKEAT